MEVTPLSGALGAEISGVDVSVPGSSVEVEQIHDLVAERSIVLFRGQSLTPSAQVAFSRCFGTLDVDGSPAEYRHPLHPEIILVTNRRSDDGTPSYSANAGRSWHSDGEFSTRPAALSFLYALQIPSVGGDTLFANQYAAYATLSKGMRQLIDGLEGVHVGGRTESSDHQLQRHSPVAATAHALVRVHPRSGRRSLFVSDKVTQIAGLTVPESTPLLDYLREHATRHEIVYRHRWQAGDLVIWDNRCTLHLALGDFEPAELRELHRTTLAGEPSGRAV